MKTLLFTLFCLLPLAHGAAPQLSPGDQKIEDIALSDTGDFPVRSGTVKLQRISAGLRYKKVVFVKAKVYVAQLFGSDPGKFKRSETDALPSLKEQKNVAIHLTFLRGVDAETIQKAYLDGVRENGFSAEEPGVKEFLAAAGAGGDGKEGSIIAISAERMKDGTEHISYVGPNGKTSEIDGPAGLIAKVFSIFLGKTTDSGLESLKKDLTAN
ncbi:MAG: hypothetical protein AB7K68_16200 [Bacteriovoracia bacterium]